MTPECCDDVTLVGAYVIGLINRATMHILVTPVKGFVTYIGQPRTAKAVVLKTG